MRRDSLFISGNNVREFLVYIFSPIALIILWETLCRFGVLDVRFFLPPSRIYSRFMSSIASGEIMPHVFVSTRRVGLGTLTGALPGFAVGVLMGLNRWSFMLGNPLVAALYPIPKAAVLPLWMILLGMGEASKIAVIASGAFFLMLIETRQAISRIPPICFEICSVFSLGRWAFFRYMLLPAILPGVLTGIRLALGYGIALMVTAEFVASESGLGHFIWNSWEVFDMEGLYMGIVIIALMGYCTTQLLECTGRILTPWQFIDGSKGP